MRHDVVTVTEHTDIAEVAAVLEAKRIKRVPVMREGKAAGIISRANLVRAEDRWEEQASVACR